MIRFPSGLVINPIQAAAVTIGTSSTCPFSCRAAYKSFSISNPFWIRAYDLICLEAKAGASSLWFGAMSGRHLVVSRQ
jgi:hypothetical protein